MPLAVGDLKACSACREIKGLGEYHRSKNRPDGLRSDCKACVRVQNAAWRAANPEKKRAQRRDNRNTYLRLTYGITQAEYEAMLATQGGRCAICGGDGRIPSGRRMPVDHCHETGRVRGILCNPCNAGLGNFRDNKDFLAGAIEYLSK